MKAKINLFLKDDNSYTGILDGCPLDISAMLHKSASKSIEMRAAILIAASSILIEDGLKKEAYEIQDHVSEIIK